HQGFGALTKNVMRITLLLILLLAAPALAQTLVTRPPAAGVLEVGSQRQLGVTPWSVSLPAGTWHLRLHKAPYDAVDLTLSGAPGHWILEHPDDDTGVPRTEILTDNWTEVLPATIALRSVPADALPLLQLAAPLPGAIAGSDQVVQYEGMAVPVVPLRHTLQGFILPRAADRQRIFLRHAGFVDTPIMLQGPDGPSGTIWLTPRYGPFSYWPVDAVLALGLLAWWRWPRPRRVEQIVRAAEAGMLGVTLDAESGARFKIVRMLGNGGMGTVYEGRRGEEPFAIKVIHPHLLFDEDARRRFAREVAICGRLSHPGLVKLVDWGFVPHAFMVMEKVTGPDLRQIMAERGPLPLEQAVPWTVCLLRALHVVHGAGVLHRDIKPGNVMLSSRGMPLLMDFGLACNLEGTHFTRSSALVGTPRYMAPEQFAGDPMSPASDVYSVGVLLYQMLSGRFPHESPDEVWALMSAVLTQPPRPITDFVPDLSPPVGAVLMQMLARDPADRYADAASAADSLSSAAPAS
ncbi:MAG: serine/threonine-protein kinase, partial [Candidatus Xenobia bacterium]